MSCVHACICYVGLQVDDHVNKGSSNIPSLLPLSLDKTSAAMSSVGPGKYQTSQISGSAVQSAGSQVVNGYQYGSDRIPNATSSNFGAQSAYAYVQQQRSSGNTGSQGAYASSSSTHQTSKFRFRDLKKKLSFESTHQVP
jgi:hypothetical protein